MSVWHYPQLIHSAWNASNGMSPNAFMWRQLIDAHNHIARFRGMRQVYSKALELGTDTSGVGSLAGRWRFRTGRNVTQCRVVLVMGLTSASAGSGSSADPYCEIDFTISGGATTTLGPFRHSASTGTINDAPDEMNVFVEEVTVTENTAYECWFRNSNYARPISICVYEVNPDTGLENAHSPTAGGPIYDAHRETLLAGLSNMYRQNGGINFHWSVYNGAAQTRSNATAASMFDGTTTGTPTAGSSNGFYVDPRYHRTASRTTVPFEWGVYASMSAGSGTCRIIDTAGSTYGSITVNSATPQWWTATFNIAESAEIFLVPQMAGDGAGTLSVYAASIIEYESGP